MPRLSDYDVNGNGKVKGAELRAYNKALRAWRNVKRQKQRKDARTDRVESRQDGRSDRTNTRQEGRNVRSDNRAETAQDLGYYPGDPWAEAAGSVVETVGGFLGGDGGPWSEDPDDRNRDRDRDRNGGGLFDVFDGLAEDPIQWATDNPVAAGAVVLVGTKLLGVW
jgi:hypothetical protein